ncbi:HAD superfamily hydrolase-like protein [Cavenderia fasciculata]|uniref:HAD superfamily hydrolase-like protein n=1 Tax=Cavenderia fasciculata TaxID=261658 RepID=F4QAX0_CACFS|nr:HAD superfamily hydrolase-like protein [Cavenderia fasciculata]EGG15029.1 HAD superfamily hydrolase-like protein [Cavenderia fasciculata]|eukprot:XP_004351749.1 HAD superfamily hydrolase-like protein [Cavenderia fasciculata]
MVQLESPFKVIALDLDGTILNSDKKVSENSKRVFQHLNKHYSDVEILLASGRAPYLVSPVETELEVDCSLIGYNGGVCLSKKEGEGRTTVFSKPISKHDAFDILKYAEENNHCLNVYGDGIVYAVSKQKQKADNYATMTGATYQFIESYYELDKMGVEPTKCLIILETDEECDKLLEKLTADNTFPNVSLVKSNCKSKTCAQYYVEFLQQSVNKGSSVLEFAKLKGYNHDQIVAFGDAENDIEMLKSVGLGICLANGTDPTKKISSKVSIYSNDQDGVAREIVELFNLPKDLIQ